ncbi:MAG: hypothetical protein ACRDRF_20330, partial [Pseudonocardiaceae bacterium]
APGQAQAVLDRLLSELRAFWQAADTALRHRHLAPAAGQPVRWATLCEDVVRAERIHEFEARLAANGDEYSSDFGHFYQGTATNWQTIVEAITWTEGFLKLYADRTIPEAAITLVVYPGDTTRRDKLQASLATMGQTMPQTNEELIYSDKVLARAALYQPHTTFEETLLAALADRVDFQMEHMNDLERWLTCFQRLQTCRQIGLEDFVTDLLSQRPIPSDIRAIFNFMEQAGRSRHE